MGTPTRIECLHNNNLRLCLGDDTFNQDDLSLLVERKLHSRYHQHWSHIESVEVELVPAKALPALQAIWSEVSQASHDTKRDGVAFEYGNSDSIRLYYTSGRGCYMGQTHIYPGELWLDLSIGMHLLNRMLTNHGYSKMSDLKYDPHLKAERWTLFFAGLDAPGDAIQLIKECLRRAAKAITLTDQPL